VLDEAKEAEKEAAKRADKEAAREAAKEAARPARKASKKAPFASTSIATGDVIRCGRAMCQATRGGVDRPLVDSPIRQAKADPLHLLQKVAGGIKVGGRDRVRVLLNTTWQPARGGQLGP
jgi:hypothetical protein